MSKKEIDNISYNINKNHSIIESQKSSAIAEIILNTIKRRKLVLN